MGGTIVSFRWTVTSSRFALSRFQETYSKVYSSTAEKELRFSVFLANLELVEEHNSDPSHTWARGVNEWTDLTEEEWQASRETLLNIWP